MRTCFRTEGNETLERGPAPGERAAEAMQNQQLRAMGHAHAHGPWQAMGMALALSHKPNDSQKVKDEDNGSVAGRSDAGSIAGGSDVTREQKGSERTR